MEPGDHGATPAGNLIYSYSTPPFRESATVLWDSNTGMIANTTIVRACEGCSYHAKLYTSAVSHFVVDVVGIFTEISAVQNLTDAGLLGNQVGDIAQNNSTRQVSLNADLLDGFHASSFASAVHNHDASNIVSGTLNVARYSAYSDLSNEGYLANAAGDIARNNGVLQVNLNADLLDSKSSGDFVAVTGDFMSGDLVVQVDDALHTWAVYAWNNKAEGYGLFTRSYGAGGTGVFAFAGASDGTGIYAQGGSSGWAGDFRGKVRIRSHSTGNTVMELGEGLDYSEGFDLSDVDTVKPGAVLVLDPEHPGKLRMSNSPYDRKVAGIVAGANGLGSGVRLGAGTFDHDVALAGRVYCNVDATEAAVEVGDLLTTSALAGHAMKVSDHMRAQGAILGKAMSRIEKGQTGQILVLVTLQ